MKTAIIWLLITYCVLKLGSMARTRNPDFRRTDVRFTDRLRAREPGLFVTAFLLSVPLALVANWYAHRSLMAQYENSATCYARLMALRSVAGFKGDVDSSAVFELVEGYRGMAQRTAADLKMKQDDVSTVLAGKVDFFAGRFATLQRTGAQEALATEIGEARRCLRSPGTAPNT